MQTGGIPVRREVPTELVGVASLVRDFAGTVRLLVDFPVAVVVESITALIHGHVDGGVGIIAVFQGAKAVAILIGQVGGVFRGRIRGSGGAWFPGGTRDVLLRQSPCPLRGFVL